MIIDLTHRIRCSSSFLMWFFLLYSMLIFFIIVLIVISFRCSSSFKLWVFSLLRDFSLWDLSLLRVFSLLFVRFRYIDEIYSQVYCHAIFGPIWQYFMPFGTTYRVMIYLWMRSLCLLIYLFHTISQRSSITRGTEAIKERSLS